MIAYNHGVCRRARNEQRGNPRLLLAMLAIDAVVLGALYLTEPRAVIYSRTVPELLANADAHRSRALRVEGALVPGSLYRLKDRCEFRFRLAANSASAGSIEVRYPVDPGYPWSPRACGLPDTFCDAPGFDFTSTVEGELRHDASGLYFAGTRVIARCSGAYRMRNDKHSPRCAPIPTRT